MSTDSLPITPVTQRRRSPGLVLELKGDFCRQVHDTLKRHGREAHYAEVSLDSPYRYHLLRDDLDSYALA